MQNTVAPLNLGLKYILWYFYLKDQNIISMLKVVQSALKRNTENLHVAKQLFGLDRRIDSLRHLQCFSSHMECYKTKLNVCVSQISRKLCQVAIKKFWIMVQIKQIHFISDKIMLEIKQWKSISSCLVPSPHPPSLPIVESAWHLPKGGMNLLTFISHSYQAYNDPYYLMVFFNRVWGCS